MAQTVDAIGGHGTTSSDDPIEVFSVFPFQQALPGDIFVLVTYAAGAVTPMLWDNITGPGGGGYGVIASPGPGEVWTKVMQGGEQHIRADWGSGQFIDRVAVGYMIRDPRHPTLTLLDEGEMTWSGMNMEFTSAVPSATADGSVIALSVITSGVEPSHLQILNPPGNSRGGYDLLSTIGVAANIQDNPTFLAAGQTLTLQLRPEITSGGAWTAWLVNGEGDFPGALTGTGRFLGGRGTLTAEAPSLLAGTGRFLGGLARLDAESPFPYPRRVPEDHLGCGVYQCFAFTRGLREIVTMLPFSQVDWGRVLDETSDATLTIDGVANPRALARCCAALSELEPEEHELAIYRNGWRVWSGPITDMTFPAEQCVIQASDLTWWLANRTIHANINSVQVDLVNILVAYVQDAMSVDNSAGLQTTVLALAGQLGDRLVQQADHQMAADVIGELARTGVDWTQIDRRMLLGPLQPQPAPFPGATPYPTLIDANFKVQPTILASGSQGANCWYVNGPADGDGDLIFGEYGPHFPATPDHVEQPAAPDYAEIEAQYGRVEKVVTESRILDQDGIDFNAQSRYDLLKRPLVYISDGALLPSTPIPMEKLLPGSLVNVHLSNVCRIIAEPYRIKNVQVSAHSDGSEDVDVQWQPLGTGETL